jgi:hypothetical protein
MAAGRHRVAERRRTEDLVQVAQQRPLRRSREAVQEHGAGRYRLRLRPAVAQDVEHIDRHEPTST